MLDDENASVSVEQADTQNLVQTDNEEDNAVLHVRGAVGCVRRRKWCLIISLSICAILAAHIVVIKLLYFPTLTCTPANNCTTVKVMALNTWGLPAAFGVKYKEQRMKAIAKEVAKAEYDIYLFEELWMEPDHETIAKAMHEANYTMTGFRQLSLSTCDGRVLPTACSGLALSTRFPVRTVTFDSYTYHGDWTKAEIDGEWFARKGVGRVTLQLMDGVTLEVFVTHTAADPDRSHGYNNSYYRVRQVDELMKHYIPKATGDVVLLAGDFNAGPQDDIYKRIREEMKNCVEEVYYTFSRWLGPQWATYGNKRNTFSSQFEPIIYDYVFHKTRHDRKADLSVYTSFFELPFFEAIIKLAQNKEEKVSFSDHEAVTSTIYVHKFK